MSVISYDVEILNNTKEIRNIVTNTLSLYNSALNYVCDVVYNNFEEISSYKSLEARMYLERLIHNTKNNVAKYDFDKHYYKLPSYLLRDIETKAIGHISSYISNLDNYKKERYESISNGKKFKKRCPKKASCNSLPSFYKDNMYTNENDNTIKLKLFVDNTWKYVKLKLKKRDLNYINKINGKRYNPNIYMVGNKIFVKFSFEVESLNVETL